MKNYKGLSLLLTAALLLTASGCEDIYVDEGTTEPQQTQETTTATTSATSQTETETEISDIITEEVKEEYIPAAPSVSFSMESGIYEEEFDLTLKALENGEIYYTTDGSDPSVSSTAKLYSEPIEITDRKNDKNVVSAVDPILFSGNFNKVNSSKDGFDCEVFAPEDSDVDKCTVIRAAVKRSDGSFGGDGYSTYFIGTAEEHIQGISESCKASGTSLAVMSISVNYDDLFDSSTGIYVKGDVFDKALSEFLLNEKLKDYETARSLDANYKQKGKKWEREAGIILFEFSESEAVPVITQNCGIRIQGNYSRSDLQKGFRLYARTEYGDNNFNYPVFGEEYKNISGETMDKFDTLVLRNGGNCAFTSKFNDTYWQSLVTEMNCATQKSRPCVVYLNGEYWGLYILQEDYTDDYMSDHYGVNKDNVIIYKGDAEALELGYKLDEGKLPEGVTDETYYFHELYNFFESHADLKSEADYNEFIKLVDPDSVLDYFAVQSWIDNKWDWPGKNWSMWKTTVAEAYSPYGDGRWRLMFYDMEFGGVCGENDARNNTIAVDNYRPKGLLDTDTSNPAVLCFAYLMTNDGFFDKFCERLTGLSEGCFEKNTALQRLSEFENTYSPLYEQFFRRYEGAGTVEEAVNGGYATPLCIRQFIQKREKYIPRMVKFCEDTLK